MKEEALRAICRQDVGAPDPLQGMLRVLWVNAATESDQSSLNLHPHLHNHFEIHFLLGGELTYESEEGRRRVAEDHLLIFAPNRLHGIVERSPAFEKLTVAVEARGAAAEALFRRSASVLPVTKEVKEGLFFLLRRAVKKNALTPALLRNRVYEILCLLLEEELHLPETEKAYDSRLRRAIQTVEDNPHIFFTCQTLAACCHISAKQLGRLFEKYEGRSLLSFLHESKVAQAKALLGEGDLLLTEVSRRLGFSDVHYFGRFFARQVGVSPGKYRKSL